MRKATKHLSGLLLVLLAAALYQQIQSTQPSGDRAAKTPRLPAGVPKAAGKTPSRPARVAAEGPGGKAGGAPAGVPGGAQAAVVEKVVDGDTIWVAVNQPGGPLLPGATHKIRILEIDTPETVKPNARTECGGAAASRFANRELAVGTTVYLLGDRQDTDRYGRFLRYVWNQRGEFYNEKAVRLGYARAVFYPLNDRYIGRMRAAEAQARDSSAGLWGAPCSILPVIRNGA